ncbi:hypothetical protein JYT72_02910, partial [Crocinitomix catalasitica]|nr:hypothetical protein [Crocinitomix catalasitica]
MNSILKIVFLQFFLLSQISNVQSQCNPAIPATANLITATATVGAGGVQYWICAPETDTLINGGGSCTIYIESYGNLKGCGSCIVYVKNCGSFDSNGGGSNTIYYEAGANIIAAGGSATLIPCANIFFDYTTA